MLTVAEALEKILNAGVTVEDEVIKVTGGWGRTLRTGVKSQEDSPPFNKSMMDGFGIRENDFRNGLREFKCVEIITAGVVSDRVVAEGECVQIMTGARVPAGIEAVIPIEQTNLQFTEEAVGRIIEIKTEDVRKGQHIMPQGGNYQAGTVIVPEGRNLRAQEVAALCEAGITEVAVSRKIEVAVLATGNELVDADQIPGQGQIRNSNEPMLLMQILQAGGTPRSQGVARDEVEQIRAKVRSGLQYDILLLTGGVSAGTLDLVPQVLKEEGVQEVFHKVSLKPGKPIWFGMKKIAGQNPKYVFGLPGNPVSSMICFELFVKPLMRKLSGLQQILSQVRRASVINHFKFRSDRPTYHPVRTFWQDGKLQAEILRWTGSSDLTSTVLANGMGVFEPGEKLFQPGDEIEIMVWGEL